MSYPGVSVEVAVGLVGGQWESVWVTIEEEENEFLSDEEITERAEELALEGSAKTGKDVAFTCVLHIDYPELTELEGY